MVWVSELHCARSAVRLVSSKPKYSLCWYCYTSLSPSLHLCCRVGMSQLWSLLLHPLCSYKLWNYPFKVLWGFLEIGRTLLVTNDIGPGYVHVPSPKIVTQPWVACPTVLHVSTSFSICPRSGTLSRQKAGSDVDIIRKPKEIVEGSEQVTGSLTGEGDLGEFIGNNKRQKELFPFLVHEVHWKTNTLLGSLAHGSHHHAIESFFPPFFLVS